MSASIGWAAACGTLLGLGLWVLVALVPRLSRPGLAERIAPAIADVSPAARQLAAERRIDPLPVLGLLGGPLLVLGRRLLGAVLGGPEATARRLRQAGSALEVDAFRGRQLAWAGAGAVLGIAASVLLVVVRQTSPALAAPLALAGGLAAVLAVDRLLAHRAGERVRRLTRELPTVLEFLALSLSAGEGVHDALLRVSRVGRGDLAAEFRTAMTRVASGVPVADALETMSSELAVPPLTRCLQQMIAALDRGAPLAEVLRAQAKDARGDDKRELLESAGRKEVAMLVPLVFLILPVTVLFAIFPGLLVLRLGS